MYDEDDFNSHSSFFIHHLNLSKWQNMVILFVCGVVRTGNHEAIKGIHHRIRIGLVNMNV